MSPSRLFTTKTRHACPSRNTVKSASPSPTTHPADSMPNISPRKFADYFRKISTLELVWGFIQNNSNRQPRRTGQQLRHRSPLTPLTPLTGAFGQEKNEIKN
jgi:hypothetical protein